MLSRKKRGFTRTAGVLQVDDDDLAQVETPLGDEAYRSANAGTSPLLDRNEHRIIQEEEVDRLLGLVCRGVQLDERGGFGDDMTAGNVGQELL